MRLLVISDLHGDLRAVWSAMEQSQPDVLLCCGDWGDPHEVTLEDLEAFSKRLPVYTVYGNHDDLGVLHQWRNTDGSAVLLPNGKIQQCAGLIVAGISGIWAKTHRKAYYITDSDVDEFALQVASCGSSVDLLLTHGCPSGVADLTWDNRHGGQRCFLRAFQVIRPRVYLTGHLHRAQEHLTRDQQVIRNVGATPQGDAVLVETAPSGLQVSAFRFTP